MRVTAKLYSLDGTSTGLSGAITLPANGQSALFLKEIAGFASMPSTFRGVLRLSSSAPISVAGLRGRYNERGDFLISTTPPVNENAAPPDSGLYFPHIADAGGYTTQFVLFGGQAGQASSGTLRFFSQSGETWNVISPAN